MEMQCTSYLPGYCHTGDLNVGANGERWPLYNNDMIWNSDRTDNDLLPPAAANQELDYYKGVLRQMMLKHEATFKDQVQELHRLYRRHREIMHELKRLELSKHHSQLQTSLSNSFSSKMPLEIVHETRLVPGFPWINDPTRRLSFLMESSSFVRDNSIPASPDTNYTSNTSEDCMILSSTRKAFGKRVFDLELPADEYMDSEERDQSERERVCEVPEVPCFTLNSIREFLPTIHLKAFHCGDGSISACEIGPSRVDADIRKASYLVDLNKPILLEEAAQMVLSHQHQDYTRGQSSGLKDLTERVVLAGKEPGICGDNVDVEKDRQLELLSYSDVIGRNGSKNFLQQHSSPKSLPQPCCSEMTNVEVKFSERNHNFFSDNDSKLAGSSMRASNQLASQYDTAKSELSSVLCQGKPAHIPRAVQALPCFNTSVSLDESSKSAIPYGNKFPLHGNSIRSLISETSSSDQPSLHPNSVSPTLSGSLDPMECVNDKSFASKDHDLPISFKVTTCTDTDDAKGIDLNSTPPDLSPDATEMQEDIKFVAGEEKNTILLRDFHWLKKQNYKLESSDWNERETISDQALTTTSSSSSHTNPSQRNDSGNSGKASLSAENSPNDVAFNLAKCDEDEQVLEVKIHDKLAGYVNDIDLNSCSNEDESSLTTLDASIKTENLIELDIEESTDKECTLLIGEYEERQLGTPLQLSEQEAKESQEDIVRIAAEAIVLISSSGVQLDLEQTPCEAFSESLYWFAGIVSYMGDENYVETILNGAADSDCGELLPEDIDFFEAMTLMLTETKTEELMSTSFAEVKERGDNLLTGKPRKAQMRKVRRRKDFQTDVVPSLASLSRHEVTEDLHTIGGLMLSAGNGLNTRLGTRNAVKIVGKRGRSRSGVTPSNGVDNTKCSSLSKQSNAIELHFGKGGLRGWGKNNKRQRAQRPTTRKRSRN